ncbi:MAG: hypothetical protein QM756_06580 [Polyangiaceae bacterium]
MATKHYVYELERYDVVAATLVAEAGQLCFDSGAGLWFLSVSKGALIQQRIE